MSNETALTITSNAPTALLLRRSVDYQAWLIAEIRNLAIVLGQTQALDSDGVRLSGMARALADTRQNIMAKAFDRCQSECTFLPVPKEILAIYQQEMKKQIDADQAKKSADADAEEARLKAEAKAHPEEYCTFADVLKGYGGADAIIGENRERLRERLAKDKIVIPEPLLQECPHCGKAIPFGVTDLRGLSAADLRSMAGRKDAREDAIALAGMLANGQPLPEQPQPAKSRKKAK